MASAGLYKHVPFGTLKGDARHMIDRKYMPRLDILQDPRNMQKEDIIDFFNHIHARQETSGPEDAFRFSNYRGRDNELHEVRYPVDQREMGKKPKKKPSQKKCKRKGKQKAEGHGQAIPAAPQGAGCSAEGHGQTSQPMPVKPQGAGCSSEGHGQASQPMPVTPKEAGRSAHDTVPTSMMNACDNLPDSQTPSAALNLNENQPEVTLETNLFGAWRTDGNAIFESTGDESARDISTHIPAIDPNLLNIVMAVPADPSGDRVQTEMPASKRKRLQTADDLAAEEASKYGTLGPRRRPTKHARFQS
jgi:hypothetical protein